MPAATVKEYGFDGDALHFRKNAPERPDINFPPYRFMPFPTCVYREWDPNRKVLERYKVAVANLLDLTKPQDVDQADRLLGPFESKQIGVHDYDADGQVVSGLREQNERALADHLANGWASLPSLDAVKAANDAMNKRVALAAAERAYDDRRLGEKAAAELAAIEDASDQHVVNVEESRRALEDDGALPKKGRK